MTTVKQAAVLLLALLVLAMLGCAHAEQEDAEAVSGTALAAEQAVLEIYNRAQEAQNAGEHEEALQGFMTVKKHYPEDWRTRAKIVQEYSALGRLRERDAEIAALYELRSSLPEDVQSEMPFFCREQFTAGQRQLMVFEYYALQGERAIKYSFVVLDKTGVQQDFKITLGSYNMTTLVARARGSIGKNERKFHLDGYFSGGSHVTYGFFKEEPEYDDVRKMVVDILEQKVTPVSGMKPNAERVEIEIRRRTSPDNPIDTD